MKQRWTVWVCEYCGCKSDAIQEHCPNGCPVVRGGRVGTIEVYRRIGGRRIGGKLVKGRLVGSRVVGGKLVKIIG